MEMITCIRGDGRPIAPELDWNSGTWGVRYFANEVKLCQECYDELIERWIKTLNHTLHECSNENCQICEGGLQSCIVCGGAEITLPTECPGRWMTDALMKKIQDQKLDFVSGVWEELNAKR